jgi:hypothetical protein
MPANPIYATPVALDNSHSDYTTSTGTCVTPRGPNICTTLVPDDVHVLDAGTCHT